MPKDDKSGIDKIISRINDEFERTSKQFENMVSDALKQFDSLQTQIQDPIKKLIEDMESIRERELKRFNTEFDRRTEEFSEFQSSIMDKFGLTKANVQPAKKTTKPVAKKPITKKPVAKKPVAKKPVAKKTVAKKPEVKNLIKDSGLTKLVGVGPALEIKLNEAGINTLQQIVTPSEADSKALENFSKVKGFESWPTAANELLG